jgi:FlaA1/EpsC-like NDP-sugar epimerase
MKKHTISFLQQLSRQIASRWLVLGVDIVIVWISYVTARILRANFEVDLINFQQMLLNSVLVVAVSTLCFFLFQSYKSIVRHTSISDTIKVFQAMTLALLILMVFSSISWPLIMGIRIALHPSVLLIFYFNSLFALIFVRIFIKLVYHNTHSYGNSSSVNVLIYGAGELGLITKNALQSNLATRYKVVGFIDHNSGKVGKTIDGIQVHHPDELSNELIHNKDVQELIFAIQNIDPETKNIIFKEFIHYDLLVKTVPPVDSWIQGKLKVKQIETIHIEDLLQRDPIVLNNAKVKAEIKDKVVLVTGGAGSIGSELVRQLSHYSPEKIIVVDNAETPMFELRQSLLKENAPASNMFVFIIADTTNQPKMEVIFSTHQPNIVFHAAAYKHVPLMEDNPDEAIRVNVFGTKIVADLAQAYQVDKFVMISTDKAVKPTNVMGASKRFAEIYCGSLNQPTFTTRFVITRFGNVLGSNGSVIKIFNQQIEKGGPVTVTHPEITRFFMTIPEACQLVLEASTMSHGGDIFVFDMGVPVKITDLAKNMIRLAGYTTDEIKIEYSGLRPGEKLYEELLNQREHVIETYHPKIMIAKVDNSSCPDVISMVSALEKAVFNHDQFEMVQLLKIAINDYISNNSQFESLDKKTLAIN